MSEKELDSGNFNEEINNTEKLVLVDFLCNLVWTM